MATQEFTKDAWLLNATPAQLIEQLQGTTTQRDELAAALRGYVDDAEARQGPDSTPGFLTRLAKGRAALAKAQS